MREKESSPGTIVKEKKKVAGIGVEKQVLRNSDAIIVGRVTKVQPSDVKGPVNPIYKNNLFLDSIKEFQADLLLKERIKYSIQHKQWTMKKMI